MCAGGDLEHGRNPMLVITREIDSEVTLDFSKMRESDLAALKAEPLRIKIGEIRSSTKVRLALVVPDFVDVLRDDAKVKTPRRKQVLR